MKKNSDWMMAGLATALTALPALANDTTEPADGTPQVLVTASRLSEGLAGAPVAVITADDIAQDPAADLPSILARQAGVQMFSLFGGVDGAQAAIGLRGFGATATENTLVLVNGRRINDPDQSNIDFAAIPQSAIERIEIIRGNAGAVLYGDGAVGGVINIVTKNGDNAPTGSTVGASLGSYQYREADLSSNQRIGETTLSFFGTELVSNGYRDDNAIRERNFDAEIRHPLGDGEIYLNVRGDDQYLGLPGAIPLSDWKASPKTNETPGNYGGLQSVNISLGGTQKLADGVELVVDAGLRDKQVPTEYGAYGTYSDFYKIDLTTASLTPRLLIDLPILGLAQKITTGLDFYQSFYHTVYSQTDGVEGYDTHRLNQRTIAVYGEDRVTLTPSTNLSAGLRLQRADIAARETVDANAPGYAGVVPGTPLNQVDNEYAANLGIDQRLDQHLSVFAGLSHAMRLPNLDDRNYVIAYPTDFLLKTQTSWEADAGLSFTWDRFGGQVSLFGMNLHNEIDYDPGANAGNGANVNLDPTRRYGAETELHWAVTEALRLHGTLSLTKAEFRAGPYKGHEVPEVSWATGDVGASWDVWQDYLSLSADLRETGPRALGDDYLGQYASAPSITTLDAKLSGKLDRAGWSISGLNLLGTKSYDLGYASYGSVSVYPLPGRSAMGRVWVSF
jgi:iron complex outermembrane receptor protein